MKRTLIYLVLIALGFIAGLTIRGQSRNFGECYDAWTSNGYHIAVCSNGTLTPEDDYIYDWEDNRDFEIIVKD